MVLCPWSTMVYHGRPWSKACHFAWVHALIAKAIDLNTSRSQAHFLPPPPPHPLTAVQMFTECGVPTPPDNAHINFNATLRAINSEVTFECNPGYTASGSGSTKAKCLYEGEWTISRLICKGINILVLYLYYISLKRFLSVLPAVISSVPVVYRRPNDGLDRAKFAQIFIESLP
jgi:hypothetical protein